MFWAYKHIIGSGVTNIGNYAFSNCGRLVNITFNGTIVQWNAIIKSETWKNMYQTRALLFVRTGLFISDNNIVIDKSL